jgi:hypothetical protein
MDIITFINSLTNEDLNRIRNSKSDAEARRLLREHQALQLLQPDVSGTIYGYALEIRSINYNGNWFRHYNHKLYRTEDCARDAIYQMKDFKFYEGFEWRVVPLYCH